MTTQLNHAQGRCSSPGGGTGIGAATARRLAGDGWHVAVTGRRRGPLEEVAAEVGGLAVVADTAVAADAERAVTETVDAFGGLDGLVLNAGSGSPGSLLDADPDGFLDTSPRQSPRRVPDGAARRSTTFWSAGGRSSPSPPSRVCRARARSGVLLVEGRSDPTLTRCIAVDHGPAGMRANCVCPGWIRTPTGRRGAWTSSARSAAEGVRTGTRRRAQFATVQACERSPRKWPPRSPGCFPTTRRRSTERCSRSTGARRLSMLATIPSTSPAVSALVAVAGVPVDTRHFIGGDRVGSDATFTDSEPDRRTADRRDRAWRRARGRARRRRRDGGVPGLGGAWSHPVGRP